MRLATSAMICQSGRLSPGAGPTLIFLPGYMSDMAGGKATAVFDWAVANEADCIVLASHRSDSALFGSTASRVARHASCAVHLIR